MKRALLIVVVSVLWCSAAIVARTGQPVQIGEHFKPMAFLAGSCWIGTFPDGKATDEHCFEWVFGGVYLRDRHIARGQGQPYEGESLYAWEPATKRVVFWYWNSRGGVSTGHVEPGADGLVFPEKHTTAAGAVEMKAVWRQKGPDAYTVTQSRRTNGDWQTVWTMEMKRK